MGCATNSELAAEPRDTAYYRANCITEGPANCITEGPVPTVLLRARFRVTRRQVWEWACVYWELREWFVVTVPGSTQREHSGPFLVYQYAVMRWW